MQSGRRMNFTRTFATTCMGLISLPFFAGCVAGKGKLAVQFELVATEKLEGRSNDALIHCVRVWKVVFV